MAQRYCTNCGAQLGDEARFCPNCGRPVHETAAVPTPEADVPVPPPPDNKQAGGTPSFAPTTASSGQRSMVGKLLIGCASLFVVLVLFVGCLAVLGSGEGSSPSGQSGGSDNAGEGDGAAPAREEAGTSDEKFTQENYAELISDPEAHEGAAVDITGQIFTAPELVEGDTAFQMFADPENSEWNTAVWTEGSDNDLEIDDYVHVVGTVVGEMEGENMMGGTVTAVMVQADEVDVVSGVEAVDPTQKTIQVGRALSDQGFSIKLKKIEFGEDTTRVYVSVYNGTGTGASFYEYDAKILQGSRQFDQETTFDYEVKAPQTDLRPGVRTDGVVTFGKVNPSQPLQVRFEWYSDNYNVTAKPIVFQVTS